MTTDSTKSVRLIDEPFVYHPRTADQLDISPMPDGLGVLIGIYNNRDNGRYTTIDVSLDDVEKIVSALRNARTYARAFPLDATQPRPALKCNHEDFGCPPQAPCGDYSGREGRDA